MKQISDAAARAIERVLDDIAEVDARAGCSDRYFRQHFTMLAKLPPVGEALAELRRAEDVEVNPQTFADLGQSVILRTENHPDDPKTAGDENHEQVDNGGMPPALPSRVRKRAGG